MSISRSRASVRAWCQSSSRCSAITASVCSARPVGEAQSASFGFGPSRDAQQGAHLVGLGEAGAGQRRVRRRRPASAPAALNTVSPWRAMKKRPLTAARAGDGGGVHRGGGAAQAIMVADQQAVGGPRVSTAMSMPVRIAAWISWSARGSGAQASRPPPSNWKLRPSMASRTAEPGAFLAAQPDVELPPPRRAGQWPIAAKGCQPGPAAIRTARRSRSSGPHSGTRPSCRKCRARGGAAAAAPAIAMKRNRKFRPRISMPPFHSAWRRLGNRKSRFSGVHETPPRGGALAPPFPLRDQIAMELSHA